MIKLKSLLLESAIDTKSILTNPNFKKWFGNSKVVDKHGNPLIVYHGTEAVFNTFDVSKTKDIGSHFGTFSQADNSIKSFGQYNNANIMPVYLKIEKPLRLNDVFSLINKRLYTVAALLVLRSGLHFNDIEHDNIFNIAKKADTIRKKAGGDWEMGLNPNKKDILKSHNELLKKFWELAQSVIEKNGFDGIVYKNRVEGKGDSFVIFKPEQVKSVYNIGDFNINNSDITKESTI